MPLVGLQLVNKPGDPLTGEFPRYAGGLRQTGRSARMYKRKSSRARPLRRKTRRKVRANPGKKAAGTSTRKRTRAYKVKGSNGKMYYRNKAGKPISAAAFSAAQKRRKTATPKKASPAPARKNQRTKKTSTGSHRAHAKRASNGVMMYFSAGGKRISKARYQGILARKPASKRKAPKRRTRRNPGRGGQTQPGGGQAAASFAAKARREQAQRMLKSLKDKNKLQTFTVGGETFYTNGQVLLDEATYKARKGAVNKRKKAAPASKKAAPKKKRAVKKTAAPKKRKKAKTATAAAAAPKKRRKAKASTKKRRRTRAYAKRGSDGKMKYFSAAGKPISKASYSRSLKARKTKGKKSTAVKKATTKKRKTMAAKRRVKRGRPTGKASRYKRKGGMTQLKFKAPRKVGSKKKRNWRLARKKTANKKLYRYQAYMNPGAALKEMFMKGGSLFAGIVGVRAISELINDSLFYSEVAVPAVGTALATKELKSRFLDAAGAPTMLGKIAPVLPSALIALGAAFFGKQIGSMAPIVQQAAVIGFFDAAVQALALASADPTTKALPSWLQYVTPGLTAPVLAAVVPPVPPLKGYGYGEYLQTPPGYGEYAQYPMNTLPQRTQSIGGYEVESAMAGYEVESALADYMQDPDQEYTTGGSMGAEVETALADDEVESNQTGFAAGTLAKTVFAI